MIFHEFFTKRINIQENDDGEQEQFSNFMDRVLRLAVKNLSRGQQCTIMLKDFHKLKTHDI